MPKDGEIMAVNVEEIGWVGGVNYVWKTRMKIFSDTKHKFGIGLAQ